MDSDTLMAVNEHLLSFVTPSKQEKMERVLGQRTDHLRIVLEDIFQPHNASAVMRSCECFGAQNLHIIENKYAFKPNSEVSMGSAKWISLHRHREPSLDNTTHCLQTLKEKGFKIVATALNENAIPLEELSIDQPIALCFGTEEDGLSQEALNLADECIKIPMFGFTQSFNISVSAALCLHSLCSRIRKELNSWELSPLEKQNVLREWLFNTVKNPLLIEERFLKERHLS